MKKIILGFAAAAALASAGTSASAAVRFFDITLGDTGSLGPGDYGTIKVEDFGTSTLEITVNLASGYAFQNAGKDKPRDAVAFNLAGDPNVTFNFLTPAGGGFGGGGSDDKFFGGAKTDNGYGQGFGGLKFDYAVQVKSPTNPALLYGAELKFQVTSLSGLLSVNSLVGENASVQSESGLGYFMLDLSGVPAFATGPAVAVERPTPPGIPEPGTWALMIMGFGGAGAMIRRRRAAIA